MTKLYYVRRAKNEKYLQYDKYIKKNYNEVQLK